MNKSDWVSVDGTIIAYSENDYGNTSGVEFEGWKWKVLISRRWLDYMDYCYISKSAAERAGKLWVKDWKN